MEFIPIILVGLVIYYIWRKRKRKREIEASVQPYNTIKILADAALDYEEDREYYLGQLKPKIRDITNSMENLGYVIKPQSHFNLLDTRDIEQIRRWANECINLIYNGEREGDFEILCKKYRLIV